jgi:hypothetical protein
MLKLGGKNFETISVNTFEDFKAKIIMIEEGILSK